MKQLPSSDSVALGCYAYVAIAVCISLFLETDFPLSVDWTINLLASIWERLPFVVVILLMVVGGVAGYRHRAAEGRVGERFQDQLDFLWGENFTGEEAAELKLRLCMTGSERDAAREAIYARLRGETKRPQVFHIT